MAEGGFDPELRVMEGADFSVRVMRARGAAFIHRIAPRYLIGSPSLIRSLSRALARVHEQRAGRRRMQKKYRAEQGLPECQALAAFLRGGEG